MFSPTSIIWVAGKLVCLLAVLWFYLGVEGIFDFYSLPKQDVTPKSGVIHEERKIGSLDDYSIITARNIFGIFKKTETKKPQVQVEKASAAVDLRLVGTHFSKDGDKIAIIENSKKSEQDIFSEGDSIFIDAIKLIEVGATSVKIEKDGQLKVLEIEDGADSGAGGGGSGEKFSISEAELTEALANLPELLSQARAVPYFRNGDSIGMRLFAIRKGSLYEKLGLKNGDIVKTVNDNNIGDPTQALRIFEQLKNERRISVIMERAGEDKTISYSID